MARDRDFCLVYDIFLSAASSKYVHSSGLVMFILAIGLFAFPTIALLRQSSVSARNAIRMNVYLPAYHEQMQSTKASVIAFNMSYTLYVQDTSNWPPLTGQTRHFVPQSMMTDSEPDSGRGAPP